MAYTPRIDPMKSSKVVEAWYPKDGLESGMYKHAAKDGKSFTMFLEELKSEKMGQQTIYDGLSLSQIFDKKAKMRANGETPPLTAFEEGLKACGIRFDGIGTDNIVGKFFQFSGADVLFPEAISTQVFAGRKKDNMVPIFAARETMLDSMTYYKIYIETAEADEQTSKLEPREEMKETKIVVGKQTVTLQKFGTYLTQSYEDIKQMRLNIFAVALDRIGLQIKVDETDDMFYTMINGDGNSNTPGATASADASGVIDGEEVTKVRTIMSSPYQVSVLVGKKAGVRKWINALADYTNPYDMRSFTQEVVPQLVMPVMYEWDTSTITTSHFYGVDKNYGIEHLTMGSVLTETENLIRQQIKGTAISYAAGHAIIDENAVCDFDFS